MWLCARRKATKPRGEAPRQPSLKNAKVLLCGDQGSLLEYLKRLPQKLTKMQVANWETCYQQMLAAGMVEAFKITPFSPLVATTPLNQ